jgi:transcriptional regulator with XRE-family HTH domain
MNALRRSMKITLNQIFRLVEALWTAQSHLSIGDLLSMVRSQLDMPQRILSARSGVPQSVISKTETGRAEPSIAALQKLADALHCDLVISLHPRDDLDSIRRKQALRKASKRIDAIAGTMALEDQKPSQELLDELLKDEADELLREGGAKLWQEER